MECEYCLSLSTADYNVLCKRSDAHWYCPMCEHEMQEADRRMLRKFSSTNGKKFVKLEAEVKTKPFGDKVRNNVKEDITEQIQ